MGSIFRTSDNMQSVNLFNFIKYIKTNYISIELIYRIIIKKVYQCLLSYKNTLKILLEFPSVLQKKYALYQLNLQGHRYSPGVFPSFRK